jgi:hypothetical protein
MMIGGTEYSFVQTYTAGLHLDAQNNETCSPIQQSLFRKRAKWSVFSSTTTSPTFGTSAHTDSRTYSAS